jgi:hypothetical protein
MAGNNYSSSELLSSFFLSSFRGDSLYINQPKPTTRCNTMRMMMISVIVLMDYDYIFVSFFTPENF